MMLRFLTYRKREFQSMSMFREAIKYSKHPEKILPRLRDKVLSKLNFFSAKIWLKLKGREALRQDRQIYLFGGFGGRRYGDNSSVIFEYMLHNHPDVKSYWVMRKDCFFENKTDREMPDKVNIIFKDSFKANLLTLIADAYIYSHGRYDITDYKKSDNPFCVNVMLDHGFTALKKPTGGKSSSDIDASRILTELDFIAASSAGEAKIHNTEWGIPIEKIEITGLARHDRLYHLESTTRPTGKNILYMPTWREWNSRKISLSKSDFFNQIRLFLIDSTLGDYMNEKGIKLQFYVHMWMREFLDDFKESFSLKNINVLDQNTDLQKIILESSLLITDYSSVSWDFLFLDKPVLFYQFDLEKYLQHTGAYIDMRKDLFGPVAYNSEDAVSLVRHFIETDFSTTPFQKQMEAGKDFAFAYKDGKNCKRLAEAINKHLNAKNFTIS